MGLLDPEYRRSGRRHKAQAVGSFYQALLIGVLVTLSSCHLVTYNGSMSQEPTMYELAGGDAPFRELVNRFYARIEHDPLLRPLFPADLEPGKERQFLFITQYFGGPQRYNQQRGHPRLRMRHAPFPIDQAARDAWVGHMLAAIDEVGFTEPVRGVLRDYFERAATFMINHQSNSGIELLG